MSLFRLFKYCKKKDYNAIFSMLPDTLLLYLDDYNNVTEGEDSLLTAQVVVGKGLIMY